MQLPHMHSYTSPAPIPMPTCMSNDAVELVVAGVYELPKAMLPWAAHVILVVAVAKNQSWMDLLCIRNR